MKKRFLILFVSVLLFSFAIFANTSGRNFYLNLVKEGKKLYFDGKYRESLDNFRISEFGLYEEKVPLKEVYLYYALANYKIGRGDQVFDIIGKLKNTTGKSELEDIKIPEKIKDDVEKMFAAVDKNYKKKSAIKNNLSKVSKKAAGKSDKEEKFKEEFIRIRGLLSKNNLKGTKKGIRGLKKIKKNDIRIKFLNGILLFRNMEYKKSITELSKVNKLGAFGLRDETCYYLSLSHYFEKNYGQAIAYYQKIEKHDFKEKLKDIIDKVWKERDSRLKENRRKLFNSRLFREFSERFKGDTYIAFDLLKEVIREDRIKVENVLDLVNYSLKDPDVYDIKFILLASKLFVLKNSPGEAISVLKRSKFFKVETGANIDIFYDLGILYYKQKNYERSRKMMLKVNKIRKNYKETANYLTNR